MQIVETIMIQKRYADHRGNYTHTQKHTHTRTHALTHSCTYARTRAHTHTSFTKCMLHVYINFCDTSKINQQSRQYVYSH